LQEFRVSQLTEFFDLNPGVDDEQLQDLTIYSTEEPPETQKVVHLLQVQCAECGEVVFQQKQVKTDLETYTVSEILELLAKEGLVVKVHDDGQVEYNGDQLTQQEVLALVAREVL
jgi:acetyl-CoA carboxylase beta subunit